MTTYNTLYESNNCWRSQSQSLATNNNHMCPKPMHNNRQRPHANICPRCHSPKIKRGCCSHCPRDGASPATVRLYIIAMISIFWAFQTHIPSYHNTGYLSQLQLHPPPQLLFLLPRTTLGILTPLR